MTTDAATKDQDKSQKSGDWSGGKGILPARETLGPLFLMSTTPAFSIVFFHVCAHMKGNFLEFAKMCLTQGLFHTIYRIWPTPFDPQVLKMIGAFMIFELILQKYMPGRDFKATMTPKGNVPIYKANGMQSYICTLVTLITLSSLGVIRPALVYDKFGEVLSSMNVFAFAFCFMLLVKGHIAPTNSDSGTNGNVIIDFYWGMELHPRILGWDVKMFTNCRMGMMFWAVGILCFAHKNMELNNGILQIGMAVNVALQLVYISKFFFWEMGYMCSMDIQHDRAGYYICWGCLVWVPSVYTSHSFYLAGNAPDISVWTGLAIFIFGFLMIWTNYDSDNQRYVFRQTQGECLIWGKKPRKIVAEYTTDAGETKKSLLLVDGWWKVSRHFHYMPEILGSLCWGLPALNSGFVGPYFYTCFLTILLFDRAFRDDDRCRKKYGPYWEKYCSEVPYMIVPFVV
jgi:Ergosterol biosynthesis ERG4/ERG24 family.